MNYDSLIIHYGELSTKGANRASFIERLTHNVRVALRPFATASVKGTHDYIGVSIGQEDPSALISRLQEV